MKDRLVMIPDNEGLFYDRNTLVVYYGERALINYVWTFTAVCPYVGANGKFCKYLDGEIVEIA